MRTRILPVLALLLAGCGGGGGEDTAVSASPPAADPPAVATPAPIVAPPGITPAPIVVAPPKAPAPIPSPVSAPPPIVTPPPPAGSPPAPPAATQPTISSDVLGMAIGTLVMGPVGANTVGTLTTAPGTTAYVGQDWKFDVLNHTTIYRHKSEGQGQTGNPRYDLAALGIEAIDYIKPDANGAYRSNWIGPDMTINGLNLTRAAPFDIGANVELNRTIAQWDAPPYFAQLQVQTDASSDTVFGLCWHIRVPGIIRLSCGKFDRLTAEFRGVRVVDDSQGLGALTWE